MNEKIITRQEYDEAWRNAWDTMNANGHFDSSAIAAQRITDSIMETFHITVEPEPEILPGVTPGGWDYQQAKKNTWEVFVPEKGSIESDGTTGDIHIGWVYGKHNARVMTGSKKLVELNVAGLRAFKSHKNFDRFSDVALEVIDQLEAMGVPVDEFRDA